MVVSARVGFSGPRLTPPATDPASFVMNSRFSKIVEALIGLIRSSVNEDWIQACEIGPETRFSQDLEMESIEMVMLAAAIQRHYGGSLAIVDWLSGRSLDDLVALSVGDLARHIDQTLPPEA